MNIHRKSLFLGILTIGFISNYEAIASSGDTTSLPLDEINATQDDTTQDAPTQGDPTQDAPTQGDPTQTPLETPDGGSTPTQSTSEASQQDAQPAQIEQEQASSTEAAQSDDKSDIAQKEQIESTNQTPKAEDIIIQPEETQETPQAEAIQEQPIQEEQQQGTQVQTAVQEEQQQGTQVQTAVQEEEQQGTQGQPPIQVEQQQSTQGQPTVQETPQAEAIQGQPTVQETPQAEAIQGQPPIKVEQQQGTQGQPVILGSRNREYQAPPAKTPTLATENSADVSVMADQQKQPKSPQGETPGGTKQQFQNKSEVVCIDATGRVYPMPQDWFMITTRENMNSFKQNGQPQPINQELGRPQLESQQTGPQEIESPGTQIAMESASNQVNEEQMAEVVIDTSGTEVDAIDETGQKIELPPSKNPDGSLKMHNGKVAAVISDDGEYLEIVPDNKAAQAEPKTQQNTQTQAGTYIDLGTAKELQDKLRGVSPNSRVYIPSNQNQN